MFDGVAAALRVPNSDIRQFGKPESFVKRRMGMALAFDADGEVARVNAKKAAGLVKPRAACRDDLHTARIHPLNLILEKRVLASLLI